MSVETISAWAGIIAAAITAANFLIRILSKRDAKKEFILFIRLVFIGILVTVAGLIVWFLGAFVFRVFAGYGRGAQIAAVFGCLLVSAAMTFFINRNAGKLESGKSGFIVTLVLMAAIYGALAWFIQNDLYNNRLISLDESQRGMVSNIIGWGISCVIGNAALLSIANFVDVIFRSDKD